MYTDERKNGSLLVNFILKLILIIIFVLLLIWLVPWPNMDSLNPLKDQIFNANLQTMKEAGIGYGAVNHPVDRDPVCGFTGVIGDVCPGCGRHEDDVKFERIRRITGYLVGTLDRFNNGKKCEERDRVKHKV